MLAHIGVAVVASVFPVATYFGIRYQHSHRRTQTAVTEGELSVICKDFGADLAQIRSEVNTIHVEVKVLKEIVALRDQVTP